MTLKVLYYGSNTSFISDLLAEGADPQPDVYITADANEAINRTLDISFDWLLIEPSVEDGELVRFLRTTRVIDDRPHIVYCEDLDESIPSDVHEYVDVVVDDIEDLQLWDPPSAVAVSEETVAAEGTDESGNASNEPEEIAGRPSVAGRYSPNSAVRIAHVRLDGTVLWGGEELSSRIDRLEANPEGEALESTHPGEGGKGLIDVGRESLQIDTVQRKVVSVDSCYYQYQVFPATGESFLVVERELGNLESADERSITRNEFVDLILDQLDDIFFVIDFDMNLLHWNGRLNQVTGYSDEELASMSTLQLVHPDAREDVISELQRVQAEREVTTELPLLTKDGETIPYQFGASILEEEGGSPLYLCGVARDISQRVEVERELEATIQKLERSNAELEQFAYVASHDLKQPLRTIRSYLDLLERRYGGDLDDGAREFVEFAINGADRMRTMIEDLLAYSQVGIEPTFEEVDCEDVLEEVIGNLRISISESNAHVATESLPEVIGDRNLLVQLFQNLVSNSIEHAGDVHPEIHVTAERDGDRWQFAVSDNGVGMTPAEQEDIFELFSSGPGATGSGIGLATCEKIVERHGGTIRVESEKGEGSTFYFTLPAVDAETETLAPHGSIN